MNYKLKDYLMYKARSFKLFVVTKAKRVKDYLFGLCK